MNIIVNDANILIDLVHLDLVSVFVRMDLALKTTDFVFEELNEEQKRVISKFVDLGSIEIIVTNSLPDIIRISELNAHNPGLSIADCSVWFYAEKLNGILLTGDGKLRTQAMAGGVIVRGIIYIFDQLVLNELLSFEIAIEKIELLYEINPRLPQNAKIERVSNWTLNKHV